MTVTCFGDSNTYGYDPHSYYGGRYRADSRWVDILAEMSGWELENLGQNGRVIPCHEYEIKLYNKMLLSSAPELLIIMLGSNDILQGLSAKATAGRMGRFLDNLEYRKDKILLVAPPVFQSGLWVDNDIMIEQSRQLAVVYEALSQRCGSFFANSAAWNIELSYDGVHFTESGHKTFAEEIYKSITKNKEIWDTALSLS